MIDNCCFNTESHLVASRDCRVLAIVHNKHQVSLVSRYMYYMYAHIILTGSRSIIIHYN